MITDILSMLSGVGSALGSIISGVVHFAAWLLAVQGLILGLMALFYGRRAFWVFASVFGFVIGLSLAANVGASLPAWAQPLLAIAFGGAGAALAFYAPRPVAAFIGGVLTALISLATLANSGLVQWLQAVIVIAVGVLGAYIFWRVFDWALIVATSLLGAGIASLSMMSLFASARAFGVLPFAVLLASGIAYQRRDRMLAARRKRATAKPKPAVELATPAPAAAAAGDGQEHAPASVEAPPLEGPAPLPDGTRIALE